MKYQKPEAEVVDFKAQEENASQWVKEYNKGNADQISAFKVEEDVGPRDPNLMN